MRAWVLVAALAAMPAMGQGMPLGDNEKRLSFQQCGEHVRGALKNASSLDWDRRNVRYHKSDEGVLVVRPFTARNSYGGKVRQEAHCLYDPLQNRIVNVDYY